MILKIEIKEHIENLYSSHLSINLINKNVSYLKDDNVIKKTKLSLSEEEIINILKHTTHWERERNASSNDGDHIVEVIIYTDTYITTYHYENSFPDDLKEFIKEMKTKLNIVD